MTRRQRRSLELLNGRKGTNMTNTEEQQLREQFEIIIHKTRTSSPYRSKLDVGEAINELLSLFHSHESQIKQDIFKKVEGLIGADETYLPPYNYSIGMLANRNELRQELRASLKALEEKEIKHV